MLYVPAINTRALEKLGTLSGYMKPDAVMFDLEDGVGPDRKEEARENLLQFFQNKKVASSPQDYFGMVRINRVDTPWFKEDASMVMKMMEGEMNVDGVVLPKIEGWKDVDSISQHFLDLCNDASTPSPTSVPTQSNKDERSPMVSPVPIWAMMETPRAILSALEIAGHPSIQGLILGTNDLSKELRLRPAAATGSSNTTREGLYTSLQTTILAARAHDKLVIDGVYNNFRDEEGFRRECIQGKEWGMDGKTLIHPNQISATNQILAPSAEEVEYARRVVACWEEESNTTADSKSGSFTGVAVLDGMMIELLHVETARRLLEQAERIEWMDKSR